MRFSLPAALMIGSSLAAGGCARHAPPATAPRPQPRAEEVADGAPLRVWHDGQWIYGRALAVATDDARVVTSTSRTVSILCADTLQVQREAPGDKRWQGALIGMLVADAVMLTSCGGERYCGEQNPLPLIGIVAGWFIGRRSPATEYVNVARPACAHSSP